MEKTKTTENVYTDINISVEKANKVNANDLPIWKNAYTRDDLFQINKKTNSMPYEDLKEIFCYTVKFEGTDPIQVTKVEKFK